MHGLRSARSPSSGFDRARRTQSLLLPTAIRHLRHRCLKNAVNDATPYLKSVTADRDSVLRRLERCIAEHDATVVGNGFIDIIIRRSRCRSFVENLSDMGVAA